MLDTLLEWLLLPGEKATAWLIGSVPSVAELFAVDDGRGRATLVIALSVLAWLAAVLVVGYIVEKIRDFDRKLTSYCAGRYAEAQCQIRILRRRIASSFGRIREQKDRVEPVIGVDVIKLPQLEARLLRCFGSEGTLRSLTADDVARKLKLALQPVEDGIKHLLQEHLVERAFGSDDGRETHRITQAGQIYLLEH
jgi:DNA-binding MarR family transcriptional regulator